MLKKFLIVVVLFVFAGILLFSYRFLVQELNKQRHPLELVPVDALVIFESQNLKKSWSHLAETNLVYAQMLNNNAFYTFDKRISKIDSLLVLDSSLQHLFENNTAVLSLHQRDAVDLDFLMATRASEQHWWNLIKLLQERTEFVTEEKIAGFNAVNFTLIDTDNQYWAVHAPPLIAISASKDLLTRGIHQYIEGASLLKDEHFSALRNYFNPSIALKVFIQQGAGASFLNNYLLEAQQLNATTTHWIGMGLTSKADAIFLSGYIQSEAKKMSLVNLNGNIGYKSLLPDGIISLQQQFWSESAEVSDIALSQLEDVCACNVYETIKAWFDYEMVEFTFNLQHERVERAIFLASKDEVNVIGQLSSFGVNEKQPVKVESYYAFPVEDPALLNFFGISALRAESCDYFVQLGDYAVFSSLEGIKHIAAAYTSNLTTINDNNFTAFQSKFLTPFAQLTSFKTTPALFEDWKKYVSPALHSMLEKWQQDVSGWNAIAWQSSALNDKLHYFSLVVHSNPGGTKSSSTSTQSTNSPNLLWSITLKNKVARLPELIKNHQTNTYELVIQDMEHVLHLISPSGKVKWSRPLNEPIIGLVNQIDIFNNGKLQFVFNTSTKIYCLDINGNNVKGYPIKLPSNASNPVAVMDYENKHDYRYLVATTDNKILNYDKEGQPVKGWDNKGVKSLVVNVIEHFVAEGKDYLYATDIDGNVYLWERKGTIRHTVGVNFTAKNKQAVYLQRGYSLETTKITFINEEGRLMALSLTGKTEKAPFDTLLLKHLMVTDFDGDKKLEYVVPIQNKVYILNSERNIVFVDAFEASIDERVTLTGKKNKYIVVGDENDKVVVIFNRNFEKLPALNQPASHLAVIGDLNNDGKDNLITIIEGTKVMVYTLSSLYGM
jgi:hypothetical protein